MCVTNESFPTTAFIYNVLERNLGGEENKAGLVEFNLQKKILFASAHWRSSDYCDEPYIFLLLQMDHTDEDNHEYELVRLALLNPLVRDSIIR